MSVLRFYGKIKENPKEKESFFATLFWCAVASSLLVALIGFSITYSLHSHMTPALFSILNLAIFASIIIALFEVFVIVFRAGLQPKKYVWYWMGYVVGKPLIGLSIIFIFDMDVKALIWGFLIASFILALIVYRDLGLYSMISVKKFSVSLFKRLFSFGMPLTISSLSFWLLTLSDRYLIEYFGNTAQVGLYGVGYQISEKILMFSFMMLMFSAYPIIVDSWEKKGEAATRLLISELSRYYFILFTPILVVMLVMPRAVVLVFSDAAFAESARVLPLISLGIFFSGATQYVNKGFELQKQSKYIAFLALIAGLLNIGMNLFFIPRFGYWGASTSCCVSYILYFLGSFVWVRRVLPWSVSLNAIISIILAALAMFFTIKLMEIWVNSVFAQLFFVAPLGLVIYVAFLLVFKQIRMQEIRSAKSIVMEILQIKK
jgi:O-antigen/teichoic acid export membrane protein